MIQYATTPLSIVKIIMAALQGYPRIFTQTLPLIALSSIVHLVIPGLFMLNPAFGAVGLIGFVLLTWFLYTAILAIAHVALEGGRMKYSAAYRISRKKYLMVLASNLIFFAIGALFFVVEYGLNLWFDLVNEYPLFVLMAVAINAFIFVNLYFAIPVIALENFPVFKAFEYSIKLVRHHWWRSFIVLLVMVLPILGCEALGILFTGKNRLILFTGYHFLLQLVFYPWIVSITLWLLQDLKLRRSSTV